MASRLTHLKLSALTDVVILSVQAMSSEEIAWQVHRVFEFDQILDCNAKDDSGHCT